MVIVAGETVDLLSHPEHTVPIRDIVAGVRLQDRVVVENLQCLYAFRINKLFFGHAAPDRMIVCYHTAAVTQHIRDLLRDLPAAPGSVMLLRGNVLHVGEQRSLGVFLHLAGTENTMQMMDLQPLAAAFFLIQDRAGFDGWDHNEIICIILLAIVGVNIMLGERQKIVSMLLVNLYGLLRRHLTVRNRRMAVEVSLVPVSVVLETLIIFHSFFPPNYAFFWCFLILRIRNVETPTPTTAQPIITENTILKPVMPGKRSRKLPYIT